MSFGGASSSMNITIRNNRNLLKRRSAFETRKEMGFNTKMGKAYKFKQATSKQLSAIRYKIRLQNSLSAIIRVTLLASITLVVGYVLFLALTGPVNF